MMKLRLRQASVVPVDKLDSFLDSTHSRTYVPHKRNRRGHPEGGDNLQSGEVSISSLPVRMDTRTWSGTNQ